MPVTASSRRRRWLAAFGGALSLVLYQLPALGFEKQWHLGGGLGVANFTESATSVGPALEAYAAYGISDLFDVRTQMLVTRHTRLDRSFAVVGLSGGLVYKLDVLSWIPYFGLELGYYHFSGGTFPGQVGEHEPGLSLDLGVDYLVTPSLGLGLELRYHQFLSNASVSLGEGALLTGLLRAEYHWGW
jgi:hypothetical protein